MAELIDLRYKIKKFYKFTSQELKSMLIAILALGFVISFNDWGTDSFNFGEGIFNLFNAILIVGLSLLVNDAGKRIWSLAMGYRMEFKFWSYGIAISLLAAFISKGSIWLIVPGTFMIHHLAGHRLGFFRYGVNYFAQSLVVFGGFLFTLMLIILLKILNAIVPNPVLQKAIIFNIIFLITNILPLPMFDGGKMYYGSRMTYMFTAPALISAAILMMIDVPVFLSIVLSLLIAVVLWVVYYISFERTVFTGPR